jgi:hypothetical protein
MSPNVNYSIRAHLYLSVPSFWIGNPTSWPGTTLDTRDGPYKTITAPDSPSYDQLDVYGVYPPLSPLDGQVEMSSMYASSSRRGATTSAYFASNDSIGTNIVSIRVLTCPYAQLYLRDALQKRSTALEDRITSPSGREVIPTGRRVCTILYIMPSLVPTFTLADSPAPYFRLRLYYV